MPAVVDPLTIDIEVHHVIHPIDRSNPPWRDQDFLPGPPVLCIDDEVMDAPISILHEEVLDVTNLAVAGASGLSIIIGVPAELSATSARGERRLGPEIGHNDKTLDLTL